MTKHEKFFLEAQKEYIDHEAFLLAMDRSRQMPGITAGDNGKKSVLSRESGNYSSMDGYGGIGTLSEKSLHSCLKYYTEPDSDCHETALEGFFADIFRNNEIIEVQTKQFSNLKKKLDVFLKQYKVTVVYPVIVNKWISRIDGETGECSEFRLSPRHMDEYDAFKEIIKIKDYINDGNLKIHLYLMDADEYKITVGENRKKVGRKINRSGYERWDTVPRGIRKIIKLEQPRDYMSFVPCIPEEGFTSADFAAKAGITREKASLALNVLYKAGMVIRIGKTGKYYQYKVAY